MKISKKITEEEVREIFQKTVKELVEEEFYYLHEKLDHLIFKLDLLLEKNDPNPEAFVSRKYLSKRTDS